MQFYTMGPQQSMQPIQPQAQHPQYTNKHQESTQPQQRIQQPKHFYHGTLH